MKTTAIIVVAFLLAGCGVSQYTASTSAAANRDGFNYKSNKNQENLSATGDIDPATGRMHFEIKTSASTPEAAIAAALQQSVEFQKQMGAVLQTVLPLIEAAARVAAASQGIPLPPKPLPPAPAPATPPPATPAPAPATPAPLPPLP